MLGSAGRTAEAWLGVAASRQKGELHRSRTFFGVGPGCFDSFDLSACCVLFLALFLVESYLLIHPPPTNPSVPPPPPLPRRAHRSPHTHRTPPTHQTVK